MSNADRLEQDLEQDREHLRETLGALEDKMSPGRLLDEAMSYFNTGPKAFASDLTTQIRDNPMPALLTGVGLAWLIMSDRTAPSAAGSQSSDPSASDAADYALEPQDYDAWQDHDRLQQAEWSCVRLETETVDDHARRLDQARAAALGLTHDPEEDHGSFSARVRGAADAVKQKGASARDKLKRAAQSARHGTSAMASRGGQGLRSAAGSSKDGAKAAMSAGLHLHETNPIATGAIGVALGALLGASVPLSRKEEAALGAVADKGLSVGADLSRKASESLSDKIAPHDGTETGSGPASSPDGAMSV